MRVQDYDIINNIDDLFNRTIIVYGAGRDGKEIGSILLDAGLKIIGFCDQNKEMKECLGCPVISLKKLVMITQKEASMVIVSSAKYREEILEELQEENISAYICTDAAVKLAIDFNIEDERFSTSFSQEYKKQRDYFVYNDRNRCYMGINASLYRRNIPILNYQPGKVGSSSISTTLLQNGIYNVHIHNLMNFEYWNKEMWGMESLTQLKEQGLFMKARMQKYNWKIISLVREPIGRAYSVYMQNLLDLRGTSKVDKTFSNDIMNFVCKELETNAEFVWFDEELKALTGIDVYAKPFDKDKGYAWIKERNIEILLLKMERIHDNVDVLAEFVGVPKLTLVNENIGSMKAEKYVYQGIKENIKIPYEIVEKQYLFNEKMKHFYSEVERKEFIKKWS